MKAIQFKKESSIPQDDPNLLPQTPYFLLKADKEQKICYQDTDHLTTQCLWLGVAPRTFCLYLSLFSSYNSWKSNWPGRNLGRDFARGDVKRWQRQLCLDVPRERCLPKPAEFGAANTSPRLKMCCRGLR